MRLARSAAVFLLVGCAWNRAPAEIPRAPEPEAVEVAATASAPAAPEPTQPSPRVENDAAASAPPVSPPPASDVTPEQAVEKWLDGGRKRSREEWRAANRELARRGRDVVPMVAERVTDPDVGDVALDVLARIGPDAESSLPSLLALLGKPGSLDRYAKFRGGMVLGTMACMGRAALPAFSRVLDAGDPSLRWRAVEALASYGPDCAEVVALLARATKDADPDHVARSAAVDALGQRHAAPDVSVPALAAALADEDSTVRRMAAEALLEFGPAAAPATAALTEALKDARKDVVRAAAAALGAIGPAAVEAAPRLVEVACADPSVAGAALGAVGRIDPDRAAALRSDPVAAIREAAYAAREAPAPKLESIAELRAALDGPPGEARGAALMKVGLDPADPASLAMARTWLHADEWGLRHKAARFAGVVRDREAVPALVALLDFGNPYGSCSWIEALGEIGPDAAVAWEDVAEFTRPRGGVWGSSDWKGAAAARAALAKMRPTK